MQDPFRAFVLGLGVMLGLVEGGSNPNLTARLHRDGRSVFVSAEIQNGIPEAARELVSAGNSVSVVLVAERSKRVLARAVHRISRDGEKDRWLVSRSEDGKVLESPSEAAAYILLVSWDSIDLGEAAAYEALLARGSVTVTVRASILVNDAPEEDARLLWNYKRPERGFKLRSLTEVPY